MVYRRLQWYYFLVGGRAKTIRIPTTPLLRIFLRLFPEQPAFLAVVQFLIGLGEVQELQNPLAAVYRGQLPGGVSIDVQRPDITTEFHQEFYAEFVAPRRRQMQARVAEVIGLVWITSTRK